MSERRRVSLAGINGDPFKTVEAEVSGVWALHGDEWHGLRGWSVTHVPTGATVTWRRLAGDEGRALFEALAAELPQWNADAAFGVVPTDMAEPQAVYDRVMKGVGS